MSNQKILKKYRIIKEEINSNVGVGYMKKDRDGNLKITKQGKIVDHFDNLEDKVYNYAIIGSHIGLILGIMLPFIFSRYFNNIYNIYDHFMNSSLINSFLRFSIFFIIIVIICRTLGHIIGTHIGIKKFKPLRAYDKIKP